MSEFQKIEKIQNISDPLKNSEADLGQTNTEKPKEIPDQILISLRKNLLEKLDFLDDDQNLNIKEKREKEQKIIASFIEELLVNKEKFSKVFQTQNGSFYFVSKEGQSWRFKKNKDGEFKDQPILNKIIFLSPEEAKYFLKFMKSDFFQEYLIAFQGNLEWIPEEQRKPYKIKKTDFKEGIFPLEIGLKHLPEVLFDESEDSIEISGVRRSDGSISKCFSSGIHLGHAVTKIYKEN